MPDCPDLPILSLDLQAPYADGLEDFVVYVHCSEPAFQTLEAIAEHESERLHPGESCLPNHLDIQVSFKYSTNPVRVLAAKCFGGQYWSLSCRGKVGVGTAYSRQLFAVGSNGSKSAWKANNLPNSKYHKTVSEVVVPLYELLLQDRQPVGLILITGSTGAAKSSTVRGILHHHFHDETHSLEPSTNDKPRPHVVIIEKPFESHFIVEPIDPLNLSKGSKEFLDPSLAPPYGLDLTMRLFELDTNSVHEALVDALRQKPAAVFLDEVREPGDWKEVIRFAGSGHLILTTAHAGSLTEAMSWILDSCKAKTPAKRKEVASVILGLVHLHTEQCGDKKAPMISLWRNTPEGVSGLVSDGLGSILPGNPNRIDNVSEASLGKSWFVRKLGLDGVDSITKRALELDLEGR